MDEQITKMQGKREYKTRCGKYKRLGDGLQGDCIADGGYTWDFYFRNEPGNKDLLAEGFCPMHCRLLHMFAKVLESDHGCKMDNILYYSVKLARADYSLPKPVLVHGVTKERPRRSSLRVSGREDGKGCRGGKGYCQGGCPPG